MWSIEGSGKYARLNETALRSVTRDDEWRRRVLLVVDELRRWGARQSDNFCVVCAIRVERGEVRS